MVVAAPPAGLESTHLLAGGLAAGDSQHLQAFAFDGTFETPDARRGEGETVRKLQVRHEIDHLLLGQRVEQAFRHERHREGIALLDLALGDRELHAARQREAERLRVLELDDAAHRRTTLEFKDVKLVVLADDAVGIEDVLEEVVEFADIGAGQTRADLVSDVAERMADTAGRGEQLAAGRDVALAHGHRIKHGLILGLVLGEVGLGRIDHADDGGELRVEFLVAERLELTHHERRQQGLVGLTSGHGSEESLAAGGIARERSDGVAQLLGREGGEASNQQGRRGGVTDGREGLDERATERRRGFFTEDLVDYRGGGTIARGDEHGEGALTGWERGFFVGKMAAIKGTAGLVAGEGVEFVEVRQQIGRSALAEAGDQRGPAFGRSERTGLTNPFDHAADERRTTSGVGLAQGERQHLGTGAGIAGQTTIDEVGRLRMTADGGQGEATGGVGADQGFDTIPEEQRDVMILGVFLAGEQRFGDRGALGERKVAQGGGEFAADLRRGFRLRETGEGRDTGSPLLGNQTDRPTAHGRVGILERASEERVIEKTR